MPRTHQPPAYRLHKARQSAVVTIDGRNRYLGPYGSIVSYRRYLDELAAWVTRKCGTPLPCSAAPAEAGMVVGELILRYWKHAQSYYVKAGRPTDEQACIRAALRPLRQLYGATPLRSFKATDLKRVRTAMIQSGLARNTINGYIERIRRMFRWGVSEDLVEPALLASLMAVEGLHRGRSEARETRAVDPVSDADIEAVMPHLSPVLQSMVRFQKLTGARPGEVCLLRPGDIDRTSDVWCYRPHSFKMEHRGGERRIFIGPQAQQLLQPYLTHSLDTYCFSPRESRGKRVTQRRSRHPQRNPTGASRPGDRYSPDSYRRAIARACERAGIHPWSPNQLRHGAATDIRRKFGIEAAGVVLGHARLDTTEIYAEKDFAQAEAIMREVG